MNKKIKKLMEPNVRFYFIFLIIFAVVSFFISDHNKIVAVIEVCIIICLYAYSKISAPRRNRELLKYFETVTHDVDSAEKSTFEKFPLPMVIFHLNDGKLVSSNDQFRELSSEADKDRFFQLGINDLTPGFSTKWLVEGKHESPSPVSIGERSYRVFGNIVRTEPDKGFGNYLASTYWLDVTEYNRLSEEFNNSRPVFAIIMLDNYDELTKSATERINPPFWRSLTIKSPTGRATATATSANTTATAISSFLKSATFRISSTPNSQFSTP